MKFISYSPSHVSDSTKEEWAEKLVAKICDDKKPNYFATLSGNGAVLAFRDGSRISLYDCKVLRRVDVEIGIVKPGLGESLDTLSQSLRDLQETVNEGEA